ncbi:unnamed protein product [Blepharisma stoltei]|uniref:RanBD1 domain-containing protein n=1 Tax=Blepharisma stoltei TaxID=1481888 RepID=A0AAU9ID01_9CILI|nr:unnamed protein product [Blepharisma stoltei]
MSEDVSAFLASKKEEDPAEEVENPEEEVKGDWKAVDLPEVEVVTGEENTDCIFKTRAKLYRWAEEQWKERGTGDVKLNRNRETRRISFVMRQDNTKKVVANFILEEDPLCNLVQHAGSDRAWLWIAHDFSEGERQRTKFAMRLGTPEKSQEFKKAFDDAKHFNHCVRNSLECVEAPAIVEEVTN